MRLRVEVLGGLRVIGDGQVVSEDAWRGRRPGELIALLALADGHRLTRDAVVECLWPQLDVEAGLANLHKVAHLVRTTLGIRSAVVLKSGQVRLLPDGQIEVDAAEFEAAAIDALERRDEDRCAAAAELYAGDLLPGTDSAPWVEEHRQQLRRLHRELLRVGGRWAELAEFEPSDEQAQRELMRRELDEGRPDDAVRRFRRFHERLGELGLRPGLGAQALYEEAVAASRSPRPSPARARVLGRTDELRRARKVLQRAAGGAGGTVLIDGPVGIGKTRLGLALVDEAVDAGWSVACSSSSDADARIPYAPVADAVEHLLAARPDALYLLATRAREAIAALADTSSDDRFDPSELLQALVQLLTAAAGSGATLLFVDDAHAADEATLSLLRHLSNAIRFQPIVLLLASRSTQTRPDLVGLRDGVVGRDVGTSISLEPLDRHATWQLARSSAGRELAEATLTTIWELTSGNPLLAHELAASVGSDGHIDPSATLPEIVMRRLATVPAGLRTVLERAAVTSAAFDADDLVTLVGIDRPTAVRVLRTGVDHGLLVADRDRHRFTHALVREVLVQGTPPDERKAIHAEAADRLIAARAAPALIAHHAHRAGRRDAVHWYVEATEAAIEAGAYRDALRFVDEGEQIAARSVPELVEGRGDALLGLGDPTAAAAYRQAIDIAEERRVPGLRIKQARALLAAGAIDAAEACVADLSTSSHDEHIRLLVVQALLAWYRDDPATAADLADRARHDALADGSTREYCDVLAMQVLAAHSAAQWRLGSLTQWMERYDAPPPSAMAIDPHLCVADYLLSSDQPTDVVVDFGSRMLDATTRSSSLRGRAFAHAVIGQAELGRGNLTIAEDHLRESRELHRRVGSVAGEVIPTERLAESARLRGRPVEADRLLDEAAEVAPRSAMYTHLLPRIHGTRVRNRDGDAALEAIAHAHKELGGVELCPMCGIGLRLAATTAFAAAGELERARQELAEVERLGVVTTSGLLGAQLTATRADVALAAGNTADAHRLLIDAAGWLEQLGHPLAADACRQRLLAARPLDSAS